MTNEEVKFIRENGRRPISLMDIPGSYFFVLFPLTIFFLGAWLLKNTLLHGDRESLSSLTIFAVGLVFLWWTIKRLSDNQQFQRIKTTRDAGQNIEIVKKIIGRLNWEIYLDNKDRVVAFTGSTGFSWGEQVTVIVDGTDLLINSRPTRQPITVFKDVKNVKDFIREFNLG